MKRSVFWNVIPCSPIEVSNERSAFVFCPCAPAGPSPLRPLDEGIRSSEMSVDSTVLHGVTSEITVR
jgi:hypothetical protein